MKKIGFIGLGIMGAPMAKQMISKGSELLVYDLNRIAVDELLSQGAKAATPAEIGEKCQVIFLILPNGAIVKSTIFQEEGLVKKISKGTVIIDMSSVTPLESRYCHDELKKIGVGFLDAPVSGGEPMAVEGTLSFMVGGDQKVYDEVLPLLYQMGRNAVLVGESGSGSTAKLANQIIVNLNIAALGEAMVFAMKAGVDPEKLFMAIRGGFAGSAVMEAKAPMIMDRNFTPGGKISVIHKDIRNVLNTAHEMDIPVPMSAQLFEVLQGLKVRGIMDEDHGALIKHFEQLSDVEVKRKS